MDMCPRHDGVFLAIAYIQIFIWVDNCFQPNIYFSFASLLTQYQFLLGVVIAQLKNLLFLTFPVTNFFPCETILTHEFERKFLVCASNKSYKMGQIWLACLLAFCLFQASLILEHRFNDDAE